MRRIRLLLLLLFAQPVLFGLAQAQDLEPDYIPAMIVSEANFRADPSTKNAPLGTYQAGTQLLLLGHTYDDTGRQWYLAALYDNGLEGYISAKLVRPLPNFSGAPDGLGIPKVSDAGEKAALIGLHALLMQALGKDPGGEVVVFEDLGLLYLDGYQSNAAGDYLKINGWVTDITPKSFTLYGSYALQLNKTATCTRNGNYTFTLAADGKGWSLQVPDCGNTAQVIDIKKRGG